MNVVQIKNVVLEADPDAKHYVQMTDGSNFTVWQEYRALAFAGDDTADYGWQFQIDRYTKIEFDPIAEAIVQALRRNAIAFSYMVEYDQSTRYIRHIFDCEG